MLTFRTKNQSNDCLDKISSKNFIITQMHSSLYILLMQHENKDGHLFEGFINFTRVSRYFNLNSWRLELPFGKISAVFLFCCGPLQLDMFLMCSKQNLHFLTFPACPDLYPIFSPPVAQDKY